MPDNSKRESQEIMIRRGGLVGALNRRDFIKTASVSAALRSMGIFRSSGGARAGGHQDTSTDLLSVVERPARPNELVPYPEDGISMAVNPPGFCWPPHDEARSYRLEVRNAAGREIFRTQAIESTVYPPAAPLSGETTSGVLCTSTRRGDPTVNPRSGALLFPAQLRSFSCRKSVT